MGRGYLLYQKMLRDNPVGVLWPGRDRFVLSCGHSSLYAQFGITAGHVAAANERVAATGER